MGAVVTSRFAFDGLEEVGAPDGSLDDDGLRRVDRAVQLGPIDDADLEPHAALGALLAGARSGIDEEEIADHHAHPLEAECIQHDECLLGDEVPQQRRSQAPTPASVERDLTGETRQQRGTQRVDGQRIGELLAKAVAEVEHVDDAVARRRHDRL